MPHMSFKNMKKLILIPILFVLSICCYSQSIKNWKITDLSTLIEKSDSVLVINFWATFCVPCIEEIPDLINISRSHEKEKVKLYLISLDLADYYPAKIKKFVTKNKYEATIAWLNESNADYFCPIISLEWSGAIPATLFVNPKTGYKKFVEKKLTAAEIENEINAAVGKP
jgi:thiol-disulfide isomerase/thioredoxin